MIDWKVWGYSYQKVLPVILIGFYQKVKEVLK
jgi:hypothetical protein